MVSKTNPKITLFGGIFICILAVTTIYVIKDRSFFTATDFLWYTISCILAIATNVALAGIVAFFVSKNLTKIVFSYYFFIVSSIFGIFVNFESYRVTFMN